MNTPAVLQMKRFVRLLIHYKSELGFRLHFALLFGCSVIKRFLIV